MTHRSDCSASFAFWTSSSLSTVDILVRCWFGVTLYSSNKLNSGHTFCHALEMRCELDGRVVGDSKKPLEERKDVLVRKALKGCLSDDYKWI